MYFIVKTTILLAIIISCNGGQHEDSIRFPGEDNNEEYRPVNYRRQDFHHHHHYHQHLEPKEKEEAPIVYAGNKQIPLDFALKLNEVRNISDLLINYVDGEEDYAEEFSLASRFGGEERAAAVMPKPAKCTPELQTVELKSSNDSSLFVYPSCTRVERCGGCCGHSLLSCQPVESETLVFQVLVSQYTGGTKLSYKQKEVVFVEQHKKCKCDCIIKKEDCNSFQEYRKHECRCMCTNLDEKRKCENNNETKLWDPNVCKCRCRELKECSTGLYFDQNKCTCMSIPVRRRFAELYSDEERPFSDRESYNVDSLSVAPLSNSKERK